MCIDMKLSRQASKDKNKAKYELGNFCEQYGLPPIAPSRKNKKFKENKPYKTYKRNKFKPNKFYDNPKNQKQKSTSTKKQKYNSHKKSSYNKKEIICHKCGKKGHYKNECWSKAKINKLQISEEDKNTIFEIFKLTNIDSYDSDKELDDQPTDSSSHSDSESQIEIGCKDNCCKNLNVLTKSQQE